MRNKCEMFAGITEHFSVKHDKEAEVCILRGDYLQWLCFNGGSSYVKFCHLY